MAHDVSIVVPVRDEQENVLPLVRELAAVFDAEALSFELIFVDDGSADGTWERIHEARAADARVRGMHHERGRGQSAALWTGLQAAGAPILATLDGDLQDDPADLLRLLAALHLADFACGVRVERRDDWLRRFSSRVARRARRFVLGVDFADTGCGLRAFRRAALVGVTPFDGWHRFLPILVHDQGVKTLELSVGHRPRVAGASKYGVRNRLWRGIVDLAGVAWARKRRLDAGR